MAYGNWRKHLNEKRQTTEFTENIVKKQLSALGLKRLFKATPEAMDLLARDDIEQMTAKEAAEVLKVALEHPLSDQAVGRLRAKRKTARRPFKWTAERVALLTRTDMAAMSPSDAARFLSVVLNHPLTANAIRVKRYNLRSAQRPDYRCRVTAEMRSDLGRGHTFGALLLDDADPDAVVGEDDDAGNGDVETRDR